ncbi:hypothetical protein ATCC90586_000020 [Pythium insidiosum]|nr:hypothetical protein ATCC90586_000020 [Pythium insidiosum]
MERSASEISDALAMLMAGDDGGLDGPQRMDEEDAYRGLSPRSRRKLKNRDQMRIARQRERETMERLRMSVERLELRFNELRQQRQDQEKQQRSCKSDTADGDRREAYARLLAYSSQLKEENFFLKTSLCEKQKLKETLERIASDFSASLDGPSLSATLKDDAPHDPNDTYIGHGRRTSKRRARPTPRYSDEDAWALITDSHQHIARIQSLISHVYRDTSRSVSVVSPGNSGGASDDQRAAESSSPDSPLADTTLLSTPPPPFFGWTIRHHTHLDSCRLLISFEKAFPHVSAYQSMVRMWENERAMMTYRDAKHAAMQSMHIVRSFNDDTYVFERSLLDPITRRSTNSSYLRWRAQKIGRQAGAGYLIGTRSIEDEDEEQDGGNACASGNASGSASEWGSQLCLCTEFRPIVGNAGCFVRISGATNLTHVDDAQQNVAEAIIGLLRWENETIGPLFTLQAS